MYEIIGQANISEIIEPSAGNGSFSNQIENCVAYDLEPECKSIIKQDFLDIDLAYKKDRLFIGNPPFGSRMNLAQKFYKKCAEMGDYIAFILPISQLDNSNSLYEFDLVHSEDLGKQDYSDRKLHCCFNIYRRNKSGSLNSKPKTRLKDVTIVRQDSKQYDNITDYDVRMCYWGDGSAGKILTNTDKKYSGEYKIIVNNDKLKDDVVKLIEEYDWRNEIKAIAMRRIKQFQIVQVLLDNIDGIE